jgi:hypothetical protein
MIKLAKLPDRTPIKLTINLLPQLHERVVAYAQLYNEAYGCQASVVDLIPAMAEAFMESDKEFGRAVARIQP